MLVKEKKVIQMENFKQVVGGGLTFWIHTVIKPL